MSGAVLSRAAPQTALAAAMERAGLRPIHHRLRGLIFQMHAEGIGEDEFNRVAAQAWNDARAKARERTGLIGDARGGQNDIGGNVLNVDAPAQTSGGEAVRSMSSDGPEFDCSPAGAGSEACEGHSQAASDGHRMHALHASTSTADGTGLHGVAADQRPRSNCPPVRTPSPAVTPAAPPPSLRPKRDFAAIMSAQPTIARGYLDSRITSDGRKWGDVGWHELDGMTRDGAVARALKDHVARPLKQTTPLRELISNARFQELYDAAMQAAAV